MGCLFCDRADATKHRIIAENEHAYARWDNFPVSDGHAEVVPKRHVVSFFDLTETELLAMFKLLKLVVKKLEPVPAYFIPDGYTIGVNQGEAAGRTVHHVHINLIPGCGGEGQSPRGGIRNTIPGKGVY